jgi:hypothetical protein
MIDLLIKSLVNLASDEMLELTRFDCHVKGLHSVPVENDWGRLKRLFFTSPKHELWKNCNISDLGLGAHSHRYDLQLTGLIGDSYNVMIERGEGVRMFEHCYFNESRIVNSGETLAYIESIHKLGRIFLPHNKIHTIYVPRGTLACWMVEEKQTRSDHTVLLRSDDQPVVCGYRKPENAQHVREFVNTWLDVACD